MAWGELSVLSESGPVVVGGGALLYHFINLNEGRGLLAAGLLYTGETRGKGERREGKCRGL